MAIGIGTVTPAPHQAIRFAYLDGAVIAARIIGTWALRSGFGDENVRVVDDDLVDGRDNPVTRARVQQAVDALFPTGAVPVEQLILAFCGHGLTDAQIGSVSWLFSDSLVGKYRVVADMFYTELLLHGVERITLISDACREAPKDLDLMRLDPVRGIVVQGTQVESPKFDRLDSCQDGHLSYMVSDPMSALPGKCVFSGVIADALWGIEPSAIDDGVITTAALGNCVRARASERAREYRLKLNPRCLVDPESAVLYNTATPLPDPNELQPWPSPPEPAPPIPLPPAPQEADGSREDVAGSPGTAERILRRVHTDAGFRRQILGPRFGTRDEQAGAEVPFFDVRKIPTESGEALEELVALRQIRDPTSRVKHEIEVLVESVVSDVTSEEQHSTGETIRRRLEQIGQLSWAMGEHSQANVIVWGQHARIASRRPAAAVLPVPGAMRFHMKLTERGTPVLVVLDDDRWTPVVPYHSLFAAVVPGDDGDVFQAYGSQYSYDAYGTVLIAIRDFASGRIGPHDVDRLAARLRRSKHADPVLGAICAYLYRATADFDSVRRIAYFYARHDQPVPFDVALLGNMPVTRRQNGALLLQVPAVKARRARERDESIDHLPRFVTMATEPVEARIGGRCPWLGLGWDYVKEPRPEWARLVDGLSDYAGEVRRSGFTVLPNEAGRELATMWNLTLR